MKELELYFHIPFCVKKCNYCDFLSFSPQTAAALSGQKAVMDVYMDALLRETLGRADEAGEYRIVSIFVGGGTPSLIPTGRVEELMETIRRSFCLAPDVECTIEVNPGTVDEEKLRRYKRAGFNRLSIGLQSAKEKELKCLGRIHTWPDFLKAYQAARRAGFSNINVDIISALPEQTLSECLETVQAVLALVPPPEHISAYSLIVEEGTPFYERFARGQLQLPDEDTERSMYVETGKILKNAGYKQYEISNYAREGYACRHNLGYWRRRDYLGFGIGSASLMGNERFSNADSLRDYLNAPLDQRIGRTVLTEAQQMEETMFLGLRTTRGVSGEEFVRTFNRTLESVYGDVIRRNERDGLLRWQGDCLSLTDRGMDLANYVMAQFLTGT